MSPSISFSVNKPLKVRLHLTKTNIKTNFFFDLCSYANVNSKLKFLRTHPEAKSLSRRVRSV